MNGAHHKALQLLQVLHDKDSRNYEINLKVVIELSFLNHDIEDYKGWHSKRYIRTTEEAITALKEKYGDVIPFKPYIIEDYLKDNFVCTLDFEELDDYLMFKK